MGSKHTKHLLQILKKTKRIFYMQILPLWCSHLLDFVCPVFVVVSFYKKVVRFVVCNAWYYIKTRRFSYQSPFPGVWSVEIVDEQQQVKDLSYYQYWRQPASARSARTDEKIQKFSSTKNNLIYWFQSRITLDSKWPPDKLNRHSSQKWLVLSIIRCECLLCWNGNVHCTKLLFRSNFAHSKHNSSFKMKTQDFNCSNMNVVIFLTRLL